MFKKVRREEIKVPADMNYLAELRDFITQTGRKFGVSEQIINSFKMAIDEAGTNIIRHAYRDWEGYITVRIIIREKSVTVCLIDQGHTYDPRLSKDPDLKRYVDIGKKGGLGIFIIRRLVDEIDYHKTVEGNELKLTKLRDSGARPHLYMPALGFSMKTRFSLIASGVLTLILSTLFVINYIHQEKGIFQGSIDAGRVFAKAAAHNSVDFLANSETWELARISAEIHRDHTDLVREVFIVDKKHIIQGAYLTEKILEIFKIPDGASKKSDDVFEFRLSGYGPVYDVVQPVILKANNVDEHLGNVHILLNEKYIDKLISRARIKAVIFFFVILIGGYAGIFWLVYVTVSPFKRLSNWVKALGRDEVQDEMEFDPSDEVGEIAKAFSDITEKFRKSQEDLAEQERLKKEMQVAQEIQQTLLPSSFPEVEGFDLASYYEAAKEVGGDYFDFVQVDQDTLGIVVADVSGKGVPGSLIMTMIRTALRTEARGNRDAADVLAKVNEFVMNDMKRGMFVTVFYIILDSKKRIINYASAGHNPMILYRGRTKKSYYLNPKGFPIGIKLPDPALFRKSITSDRL
ncbi:ATP-binding protein, partial [bacterium]|nr:ATP-binding protein [bacterium]